MPKPIILGITTFLLAVSTLFAADPASDRADSLRWNLATTVGDYERGGHTNPKWDTKAKRALKLFAEIQARHGDPDARENLPGLLTATEDAIAQGCDDLLIRYIAIKNNLTLDANNYSIGKSLGQISERMADAGYSPVRVFFASLRASQALSKTAGQGGAERHKYRQRAARYLGLTLEDPKVPFVDVYGLCRETMVEVEYNKNDLTPAWKQFEKPLFRNWPDRALTWSLQGWYYISEAWLYRGSGTIDTVTDEGWKKFGENLELARAALEKSWKLDPGDPHAPTQMITVALGLQWKREEMEKWFDRAMTANTNNYDACSAKLNFLAPKWYGSDEAMLAFGRKCASSSKWGGHVPLILLDAHKNIASRLPTPEEVAAYWHRDDVWADLHQAFERFFALNPTGTGWHHDYAKAAYNAGRWKLFLDQCDSLGPVNYKFFGGEENFRRMKVEAARRLREDTPPKP